MLFDDSPRFVKSYVANPVDPMLQGIGRDQTSTHVGPGTYRTDEDKWNKRSFNTSRAAFNTSPTKSEQRGDSYIYGAMMSGGILSSPRSARDRHVPGPGYYECSSPRFGTRSSSPRERFQPNTTFSSLDCKGGHLSSTPRFNFSSSAVLRGEVLFQSASNEKQPLGPGSYSVKRESFLKPSHNVRANVSCNRHLSNSSRDFAAPSARSPRAETPGSSRPGNASHSVTGLHSASRDSLGSRGAYRGAPSPAGPRDYLQQQQQSQQKQQPQQQRAKRSTSSPGIRGSRSRAFNTGTPSKGLFSQHGMIPVEA